MTKRRDLIKALRNAAAERSISFELIEGGNHSIVILDGLKVPIPRHNEVREITAREIYKQCAPKPGEEWWK